VVVDEVATIAAATVPPTPTLAVPATLGIIDPQATTPIPGLTPENTPLPVATNTPVAFQVHTVQPGDTLFSIAQQYEVAFDLLLQVNNLADTSMLFVAQELIIPPANVTELAPEMLTAAAPSYTITTLGFSGNNRPIERYTFGSGPAQIVFVGSIHGGYEWNTTVLAYQAIDYFAAFPDLVPETVTLHIIPTVNPDGIYRVTQKEGRISSNDIPSSDPLAAFPGRFNANEVDLNRNWECNWSETALWRDQEISGGAAPFSEVENQVLRDFVTQPGIAAVIFWHSAAAIVSPGRCNEEAYEPANELAEVYSAAAGYPVQYFLAYEITGDASDWLATQDIPSIAVELTDHFDTEWPKNLAGILAVLAYYK
jgi:g-D-glutamyl-meso-diaminopimelate peptidase